MTWHRRACLVARPREGQGSRDLRHSPPRLSLRYARAPPPQAAAAALKSADRPPLLPGGHTETHECQLLVIDHTSSTSPSPRTRRACLYHVLSPRCRRVTQKRPESNPSGSGASRCSASRAAPWRAACAAPSLVVGAAAAAAAGLPPRRRCSMDAPAAGSMARDDGGGGGGGGGGGAGGRAGGGVWRAARVFSFRLRARSFRGRSIDRERAYREAGRDASIAIADERGD